MSHKSFSRSSVRFHAADRSRRSRHLKVESLEGRNLLTTLSVDIADSGCAVEGDHKYCQIQDAIDAAAEGDMIEVSNGTYEEIQIRTDHLTLRAVQGATPTIDAGGDSIGVELRANGVTVQGLAVDNAWGGFYVMGDSNTLTSNQANRIGLSRQDGDRVAFFISGGDSNTLSENTANNVIRGFSLLNSNSNTLENNHVSNAGWTGFALEQSHFNTLHQNTAFNTTASGFTMSYSDSNVVTENTAEGSQFSGINVLSSSKNTIAHNMVRGNGSGIGVFPQKWFGTATRPKSNIFEGNTSEGNFVSGFLLAETDSNTFRGNLAKDNGFGGFDIADNILDKQFGESESNTFKDNVVIGNGGYAFSIPSVDEALAQTFENNSCVENASGATNHDVIHCSLPAAGDANLDGKFNQLDIVQVLQANKYLSEEPAVWTEGDWSGDGQFNQADIVAALQTGNYLA